MPNRSQLLAEARFVGSWGRLLAASVPEAKSLAALADQEPGALGALARTCSEALERGEGLRSALADASGLSFWIEVLLLAESRDPQCLIDAGAQLEREAQGPWRRGWLWTKLAWLRAAGAPLGDGFGALAREARDHGLTGLAEGFYAAARAVRKGSDPETVLRDMSGVSPTERLVLASDASLDQLLPHLAGLGAYDEPEGPVEPATALEEIAQAAGERAAPIKRGIDKFLAGIEGALGIDRAPSPRAELARKAVEARARRGDSDEGTIVAPDDSLEDSPPVGTRAAKTIGPDSGPIDVSALPRDEAVEAWAVAFEEAQAKMTLLDVQPAETGVARELAAELKALRADLEHVSSAARREHLDALELRFAAWREANDD